MQDILDKWNIKLNYNMLLSMWNEPQRHYHNQTHLVNLISNINESKTQFSQKEYEKLMLTALFHDIIYDPMRNDNEERSAEFFEKACQDNNQDIKDIKEAILDTKGHTGINKIAVTFNKFDMAIVESNYDDLLQWEDGIYNEYKFCGNKTYKKGRLDFINSILDKYPNNSENLLKLSDYIRKTY